MFASLGMRTFGENKGFFFLFFLIVFLVFCFIFSVLSCSSLRFCGHCSPKAMFNLFDLFCRVLYFYVVGGSIL